MKLTTINIAIISGPVVKGGKVSVWPDGNSAAFFTVMTDSFRRTMAGGHERIVEYHACRVNNDVFDDLYELVAEGNYVHVSGDMCSYEKAGKVYRYVRAEKCSLLINSKKIKE